MGRPSRLARLKRRNRAKRLKNLERKARRAIYLMKNEHPCQVCGTVDDKKPMCYQGEDWCCENHRKQILGDSPQKRH